MDAVVVWLFAGLGLLSVPAEGTVEMQAQAKRLGFQVANCLYCHASEHATEAMKQKARALGISEGNCLACHAANIPVKLNDRGHWLVAEKARRQAKEAEMAWLKNYVEPTPAPPKPTGPKSAKP